MKKILVIISLIATSFVYGVTYSNVSTVKGMTVGDTGVRVQLESMKPAEQCSTTNFYFVDTSISKDMYSALLAAKASGQKVSFQLIGCHNNIPKVTQVYLCDTHFCS